MMIVRLIIVVMIDAKIINIFEALTSLSLSSIFNLVQNFRDSIISHFIHKLYSTMINACIFHLTIEYIFPIQ